jgi:hypothetical protein
MNPADAMVFTSAMAAARFDGDRENMFIIQTKETT